MSPKEVRVLLVEDEQDKADKTAMILSVAGAEYDYAFTVARVRSVEEGLAHLDAHEPGEYCDVALLDQELGVDKYGGRLLLDEIMEIPESERPIAIGLSSEPFGISPLGRRVDVDVTKLHIDTLVDVIHDQLQRRRAS